MRRQMMCYADDTERAREMELAAAERQMSCSCSPFRTMISRAIKGRRNGREDGRSRTEKLDYAMAYPPVQTYYVRPNARTIAVTSNNAPAHTTPPEPTRSYAAAAAPPPPRAAGGPAGKPRKKKKKKRVAFAPEAAGPNMHGHAPPPHAGHAPPPHAGHAPQHFPVAASSSGAAASGVYHQGAVDPYTFPAPPGHRQQGHAYGYGYGRWSAPSPLTRWDVVGTPRRHEYFSSEYRWYYPTPVRESIYSFATDANHRLTAIFSEENPNACAII